MIPSGAPGLSGTVGFPVRVPLHAVNAKSTAIHRDERFMIQSFPSDSGKHLHVDLDDPLRVIGRVALQQQRLDALELRPQREHLALADAQRERGDLALVARHTPERLGCEAHHLAVEADDVVPERPLLRLDQRLRLTRAGTVVRDEQPRFVQDCERLLGLTLRDRRQQGLRDPLRLGAEIGPRRELADRRDVIE